MVIEVNIQNVSVTRGCPRVKYSVMIRSNKHDIIKVNTFTKISMPVLNNSETANWPDFFGFFVALGPMPPSGQQT